MSHLAIKSLSVCLIYGVIAIFQTLNARYLFRTLNFNFYSFTFGIQRIAIIIFFALAMKINIRKQMIIKILPYSLFMCLNNIIPSYCLTIMPLAAFLAFKKFIVLFILGVNIAFNLPNTINRTQNYCIIGIVIGGALVGQRDMLHGNVFAYLACLTFDLFQALSLQYSNYLYRRERLQPSQLLLYNCLISLPYYLITIAVQAQFDDIYYFFQDKSSFSLILVILFSIFLACISELSSSYIAMKISPFEKSIVANIKDLILMVISVVYLHDYTITPISGFGIVLCLICSALFSVPYLEQKDQPLLVHQGDTIEFHHHDGTSLLDDKKHSDHRSTQAQTNDSHHDIMQEQLHHEQSQIIYLKPKDESYSPK